MRRSMLWLSVVAIGAASAFNLLGGLGTTCVALYAERFSERMAVLAPYKWLYWIFVVAGVVTGLLGAWSVPGLVRGRSGALGRAAAALVASALVAGAHAGASLLLRGSAAPADMRLYVTLAALVLLLLAGAAGAFVRDGGTGEGDSAVTGAALLAAGAVALVAPALMSATHVLAGADRSLAWGPLLPVAGGLLVLSGAAFVARRWSERPDASAHRTRRSAG